MTWKDRMKWVVEGVLNEGREHENPYKLEIVDDRNTTLRYDGAILITTEHLHALHAHWRAAASDLIKKVIQDRIDDKLALT